MPRSLPLVVLLTFCALLFVHGGVPPLQAREGTPDDLERFEGEVEVSEVLLDVLVTDAAGNVVMGLDEGDFVVEENAELMEIQSVSFYSNRRFLGGLDDTEPEELTEPDVSEDRYFVLFFYRPPLHAPGVDRRHFLRLSEVGRRSFEWSVKELLPRDHVAVVAFGTQLELYHEFTRDRQRLSDAIHRAALGKPPEERWTSRAETPDPEINLAALPAGDELRRETQEDVLASLRVLAEALGPIRGRKNLIVFGADLPAESTREWAEGYLPMVESLNTHNVAAYTIGVASNGMQRTLLRLAEDTGGEYTYRIADYLEPLRKIAQENSGYYLLSYRSPHPAGQRGYQEVTVRTVHEGFQVRSRSGYSYGPPTDQPAAD